MKTQLKLTEQEQEFILEHRVYELRTGKSYLAIKNKADMKQAKELSEKTGLQVIEYKRIIQ